jgi:hypothetical protein
MELTQPFCANDQWHARQPTFSFRIDLKQVIVNSR